MSAVLVDYCALLLRSASALIAIAQHFLELTDVEYFKLMFDCISSMPRGVNAAFLCVKILISMSGRV